MNMQPTSYTSYNYIFPRNMLVNFWNKVMNGTSKKQYRKARYKEIFPEYVRTPSYYKMIL